MKTKNLLVPLLLLSCCVPLSSCATVCSKSVYRVKIDSNPSDAKYVVAYTNGVEFARGRTPDTIELDASKSSGFARARYIITLSKPGYEEYKQSLSASLDGFFWGNFILLPYFWAGMLLDGVTGAQWKLPPEVKYDLIPEDSGTGPTQSTSG